MLFIVPTPIGNLEDITFRAVRTLKEVDYIACEDTRTSGILLKHYDITTPTLSYHAHSSPKQTIKIIDMLQSGKDIALISDAGTPGISDPGYALIQAALEKNIPLTALPGASASITALSASGKSTHHFLYLGFLPIKKGRQTLFTNISQNYTHTIVIYESVHRIEKTLGDIGQYFGYDHHIVVARELTKKFETYYRGTVTEIQNIFTKHRTICKGEFVILI